MNTEIYSTPHRSEIKLIIVLPTYNERDNIVRFIPKILNILQTDILIIDDNSPDETGKYADMLAEKHAEVFVLHRAKKMGLGSAYVQGFQWALQQGYEYIAQMDSDFSHDPHDLPLLIKALENADLAIGSRYISGGGIKNWPWYRLAVSQFGSFYSRSILNAPIRDLTGGFKIWKRNVLEKIQLDKILSDGYTFQIETTFRALKSGFKIKEVPIIFKDRTRGKSKISRRVVWEAIVLVWKLRFSRKK